jgi:hypothetical protein
VSLRPLVSLAASLLAISIVGYVVWTLASAPGVAPIGDLVGAVSPVPAAPAAPDGAPTAAAATPAVGGSGVPTPDPRWVTRMASRAGIPVPAMRAYARAQLARPAGCALGWTTVAGIGWVESQHGTLDGRALGEDGVPSTPIVGPALTGGLDHAYGPMQFIPSTWARWASDGDGDGRADVDDLDDAAMAAMRYLCASGQDLASGAGWSRAVFSYNRSQDYVSQVYAAASAYAARTR